MEVILSILSRREEGGHEHRRRAFGGRTIDDDGISRNGILSCCLSSAVLRCYRAQFYLIVLRSYKCFYKTTSEKYRHLAERWKDDGNDDLFIFLLLFAAVDRAVVGQSDLSMFLTTWLSFALLHRTRSFACKQRIFNVRAHSSFYLLYKLQYISSFNRHRHGMAWHGMHTIGYGTFCIYLINGRTMPALMTAAAKASGRR